MRTAPVHHETRRHEWDSFLPSEDLVGRPDSPAEGQPSQPHPDELFSALDGSTVSVDSRVWRIHVFSISDHNGSRWFQLGLGVRPAHNLTLKTAVDDGIDDILAAIRQSLSSAVPVIA
jgi:hypothetical protein